MAKPRVFISSTYYDLKHIRASLDIFVEALGFEPVLSEKGDIAYTPDVALDESCYREVMTADVYVLIIGGRYGSEASDSATRTSKLFFDRYESITKKEYQSAVERDVPTYILIESSVYAEYHTFLRNRDSTIVKYAHVDSVNIFKFIEEILARPRNNPVHTFERFADIEQWLREQWAGLFRELLRRRTDQKQLAALSNQVEDLKEVSNTLKRYLEAVLTGSSPADSSKLIADEEERLKQVEQQEQLRDNDILIYLNQITQLPLEQLIAIFKASDSVNAFASQVASAAGKPDIESELIDIVRSIDDARIALFQLFDILQIEPFKFPEGFFKNLEPYSVMRASEERLRRAQSTSSRKGPHDK